MRNLSSGGNIPMNKKKNKEIAGRKRFFSLAIIIDSLYTYGTTAERGVSVCGQKVLL
jgi:hypothetical protein